MIEPALREGVIRVARAAAAEILKVYRGEFDVDHKDDRSPVTAADLAAHRSIAAGLASLTPAIPLLSEESSSHDIAERRRWSRLWLVDPLDGTREFIKRNGEFTVNIALIESGVATWGVIQAPATGVVWHGGAGLGAFRRETEGSDRAVQARAPATPPLRVAASRSHRDQRSIDFIARMGDTQPLGMGSSLKFCLLAEGELDVYPRFGPTSEWDTAAGQAILEGAGGELFDPLGRPFRYNQRASLLNGGFVALGDPALPWQKWCGG
ncbi:3'(2'),5'-bisphosphate nucleotidase CysQ [Lysobacter ciconiae]|uniref:3'(2'),5'-bisphosphate nucleotidase CysQ n=1 Tax=Novilysobacter ciconiae TaxID=2781022 RepID=A0A7S6ZRV3_9GAMM|nr:3'(2'),5'-bisphosphate nucleotidase CysQ [Lysobacter ciconiae]QOW19115.1 3'(2'),5'-bisphosphate nucleotidase CysQ [Lysobacter ciconiae]